MLAVLLIVLLTIMVITINVQQTQIKVLRNALLDALDQLDDRK
jgi:hypothetical protein